MSEDQFRLVLQWFKAKSGSPEKYIAAGQILKELPGVEPWTWRHIDASKVKFQ